MNYHLRDIDEPFWHKVKVKAAQQKVTIKDLILRLLQAWLKEG